MPTGCRSVYLSSCQHRVGSLEECKCGAERPAGDFEGGAKDLGTHKLRHDDQEAEAASNQGEVRETTVSRRNTNTATT